MAALDAAAGDFDVFRPTLFEAVALLLGGARGDDDELRVLGGERDEEEVVEDIVVDQERTAVEDVLTGRLAALGPQEDTEATGPTPTLETLDHRVAQSQLRFVRDGDTRRIGAQRGRDAIVAQRALPRRAKDLTAGRGSANDPEGLASDGRAIVRYHERPFVDNGAGLRSRDSRHQRENDDARRTTHAGYPPKAGGGRRTTHADE